jgi:carboxypeptidase C (cathepsin A)
MIRRLTSIATVLCLSIAAFAPGPHLALAQDHGAADAAKPDAAASEPAKAATGKSDEARVGSGLLALLPADSVTTHTLQTASGALSYTATAGTLNLFGGNGERSAAIFYTAYVAKDAAAGRPLTFVFNGGPGAASAYLHLGLVGPRILDFGPSGRDGANARLVDNPHRLEPRREGR